MYMLLGEGAGKGHWKSKGKPLPGPLLQTLSQAGAGWEQVKSTAEGGPSTFQTVS